MKDKLHIHPIYQNEYSDGYNRERHSVLFWPYSILPWRFVMHNVTFCVVNKKQKEHISKYPKCTWNLLDNKCATKCFYTEVDPVFF